MFDELSSRLSDTLRRITGKGVLTEEAVREGLREIRRILLEADVSFVGSSRVDLQACKLEYSIVSPK